MKPLLLLVALLHAALVRADGRIAPIFIQPISTSETAPSLLAEIQFDTAGSTSAPEVISYEVPAFPDGARLARVGIYNSDAGTWASSTSVMSLENFDKGYAPHFTVSIDAAVVVTAPGKQPELNKPVILSPEGKKIVPEEKSFLQKYWWDPTQGAAATDATAAPVADVKGKGKAAATEEAHDTSMATDEDDEEEDEAEEGDEAAEEEEDGLEEIDPENVLGKRTRGKVIDFAKAAKENPVEEDEDEDEDDDFEVEDEKMDED
ncbi:hypothetical protein P8C59_007267 [Phyllachora maydis]|uniref:Histone chaperone domain-containing protein n=1 Tax=Phyllachora maydis TaxID=1825666 RepID=A0AAD9I812_9PEZI|nr:hypothetical protein P8C59_007267 [Phyllachora maydis]